MGVPLYVTILFSLVPFKIHSFLKIILFIFGCAGSSLLPVCFLLLQGLLSTVVHGLLIAVVFCGGAQALDHQALVVVVHRLC